MVNCQYQTALQMLQNLNHIIDTLKLPIEKPAPHIPEDNIIDSLFKLIAKIKTEIAKTTITPTKETSEDEVYVQIQKQLQKQQNLNRCLIKKQLQFKEYQKCLMEELDEEKKLTRNLKKQLNKYCEVMQNKEIELALLSNQKKMMSKEKEVEKKTHRESDKKVNNRDKKTKEIMGIEHFFDEYKINEFNKNGKANVKPTHERRRSDEITKRPATANLKKKSTPKK